MEVILPRLPKQPATLKRFSRVGSSESYLFPKNPGIMAAQVFFFGNVPGSSFSFFFPKKMWGITESPSMFSSWSVVSTHLKNISQIGNLPQIEVKIKKIETSSKFRVTLGGCCFVEPLHLWCVIPFGSFGSPGITDGGRVAMLHVLRVGIARKFAGPQNEIPQVNSTGGQAPKKSETS